MRTKEWAYIQYKEDASRGIELYDMINDPSQFNNLAKKPDFAKVIAVLQKRLTHKLKEVRKNDL
ncbi:hypothetical protein D3C86_1689530 [compost metagenome]